MHDQESSNLGGRYVALAARAYEYLCDHQGAAAEDDLVREVFGPSARGPVFANLLAEILDDDPRFGRGESGRWVLPGFEVPATPPDELKFVVLDLQATGLKGPRHRLFELAALRLVGGVVTSTFTAVLNPERRFPAFLTELTGLTQGDLAEAPPFARVADDLLAFLGDAVLVGHGLTHDVLQLNRELQMAGRPPLANHVLDTLALAERYLPNRGKPTLDNLAACFGIPVGRRHRALADAHLVAGVLPHLLELARVAGARTLADLPVARREAFAGFLLLDASALDGVPNGPGVYLLKAGDGRVVYVGKAVDLHSRVATYFSRPPAYVRRMEGLLEAVADFETVVLGSELEALLEEARLIALHRPRFNVQLATKQRPRYLRLDAGSAFPRLEAVAAPAGDEARYVGPFANEGLLRTAQRHLEDLFPLATCRRRLGVAPKGRKQPKACRKLDQGRCLGPCLDPLSRQGAYRGLVDELMAYLDGTAGPTRDRLRRQLAEARALGDRKAIARHRRLLAATETPIAFPVEQEARHLRARNVAVVQPSLADGRVEVFLLREGRYAGQLSVTPDEQAADLAVRLKSAEPLPPEAASGRGEILRRWLGPRPDAAALLPEGEEGWVEAAVEILALAECVVNLGPPPGTVQLTEADDWPEDEDE